MNFYAGNNSGLSSDDDAIAGSDSGCDDYVIALTQAEDDRANFGSIVGFDDENVWTSLADLRGLIWNQHCFFQRRENQADIYKLPRPEAVIRVRDRGSK